MIHGNAINIVADSFFQMTMIYGTLHTDAVLLCAEPKNIRDAK